MAEPKIVVMGAAGPEDLPQPDRIQSKARLAFATEAGSLRRALPGAKILLGWDFRADQLAQTWDAAKDLEWIHWCGAGVDAVLFPALRNSRVTLTNSRGVFDRPMAEYVLGLAIAMARGFPETFAAKASRLWTYRETDTLEARRALIVGVGSIGRSIARLLRAVGMRVSGVGRTARESDPDFDRVVGVAGLDSALADADLVVNVTPLTEATRDLFSSAQFAAMKPTAYFINVGRGASVDEDALAEALDGGTIAGAALDVFRTEPLPGDSRLWDTGNLIISPHMSGDTHGYPDAVMALFADNLERWLTGRALRNVVDKTLGFVRA